MKLTSLRYRAVIIQRRGRSVTSNQPDLWDRRSGEKSERNGYWVLWPLCLLLAFEPSFHRPLAALPLVVLSVARERNAGWAWHGSSFWIGLALFGAALIGANPIDLIWLATGDVRRWVASAPYVLVLPGLGLCGLVAMVFARAREGGLVSSLQQDRLVNNLPLQGFATLVPGGMARSGRARPDPRLAGLLSTQMDASARYKTLSDRQAQLLAQGDHQGADQIAGEVMQAKRDYEGAREAVQSIKRVGS